MHVGELLALQPQRVAVRAITPGASPYVYTAPRAGSVVLSGGTVTLIEYGRSGGYLLTGLTTGVIPMAAGDTLRTTYAVVPTMTFVGG